MKKINKNINKKTRARKNRRIKYNEEHYINKNYIINGKAIIPVLLENTNDLFMKHDFKKFELSDDVCKYIEEIAYMIPFDYDIIIEIHCKKIDDIGNPGDLQLRVISYPNGYETSNVIWESQDPSIASIDNDGNITLKGEGRTIITARIENTDIQRTCILSILE